MTACVGRKGACDPQCPGWGWFLSGTRGWEIERCDECARFECDDDAIEHVKACKPCRKRLGEYMALEELGPEQVGEAGSLTLTTEQDYGPYETLFRAYQDYNVRINGEEVAVVAALRDGVRVRAFLEGDTDEPTSLTTKTIPYGEIEALHVY